MDLHIPTRRVFMATAGALVASVSVPRVVLAAGGRDPRFLFVFLRGALDGLAAVAPVGDPAYEAARGGLELSRDGATAGLPLDGTFVLNPNMPYLHGLYRRGEASIVHAVASPYRDRSHFDGQDVVETGLGGVGRLDSGWLNRALGLAGSAGRISVKDGLAIGSGLPIVMRGPSPVVTWLPPGYPAARDGLQASLLDLYRHADPRLASRLEEAIRLDQAIGGEAKAAKDAAAAMAALGNRGAAEFRRAGLVAGQLMARDNGPRIATMSFIGWDTHADESPLGGRLGKLLESLDAALEGLATAMAPVWKDTVVVVATEFGRTVHMNGTSGSDHGTGSIALLVGGAVKGGRVVADWPGLAAGQLYENRDLRPTTDLRAVFKGVLADHLGFDPRRLAEEVFPDSAAVRPLTGLVG
jgi:uncharacterized protein (DUF1501 family)